MPTVKAVSSAPYDVIFDQASDAIVAIREDGTVEAMNVSAENLTGYLRSELQDQRLEVLSPIEATARERVFSGDLLKSAGTFEDVAIRRKDGYVRIVDLTVRWAGDGKRRFAIALFRDVTEKKNMERELITKHAELRNAFMQLEKTNNELRATQETLVQAGKMAALGELAAGLAHELNQPLQAIRGYAQEMIATGEARTELGEIISAADKMAAIIDHLRVFTRQSTERFEWTNVSRTIDEALSLLGRQLAVRGIKVERHYEPALPEVFANPIQLEQVFINLASNARDAIEATGRGHGKIEVTAKAAKGWVEVEFRDDGCGMAERTKSKVFNPFFTTKEVGKGMGLGLSLSYGILSKLNGGIVVESELGKGAKFTVRVPTDFREMAA